MKSKEYKSPIVEKIVSDAINFADDELDETLYSDEHRDDLLRKLYTALAISNDSTVKERINNIENRYGKTGEKWSCG